MANTYYPEGDGKITIPHLNDFNKHFLDKNILISGGCQSGKTTIVNEIVKKLSNQTPNIIRFVMPGDHKSLDEKYNFDEKLPINTRKVISLEVLEQIIERQKKCSTIYACANDIEILESIYNKLTDETDFGTELVDPPIEHALKKNNYEKMPMYKKYIESHKQYFLNDDSLNERQKLAVLYSNFCPNIMLIFDGCEDFLKKHHNHRIIKEMFTSDKSYNITKICTLFSSKHIHPHIRRNFDTVIFTSHYEALDYFSTASNGYDKHTRRLAELAIQRIFSSVNGVVTYRKLAFFPCNNIDKFQCILVDNL